MSSPLPQPTALTLAQVWVYPIKSCAGHPVPWADIAAGAGLAGDRNWVLVDDGRKVVWMGGFHRMALVHARAVGRGLRLQAAGFEPFDVPGDDGPTVQVEMWNDTDKVAEHYAGTDAGDRAAEWLSTVVGQPLRLVRLGADALRRRALEPLHVVSLPSLRELDRRLAELGQGPIVVERFRPNLVVDHAGAPFAEEAFARIDWPDPAAPRLDMTIGCVRCVMPNIDPVAAVAQREPLVTVTALSRARGLRAPTFGMYARAAAAGRLVAGASGFGRPKE